jgi:GAF domain-containing protein
MEARESERLKAVKRFDNFDFALNKAIQGILNIVADIYETPAAFVTLIDEQDQWFKVNHGFEVLNMPRSTSFCTHTIMLREPMVVCDALTDERFADNPFVKNAPNIRFYAGAALTDSNGQNIGTICVMDARPRTVPDEKKQYLTLLAKQTIHLMELELNYKLQSEKLQQTAQQNSALKDIAYIQSYEFRQPLHKIAELVTSIKQQDTRYPEAPLLMIESIVNELEEKINIVEESTEAARDAFTEM